MTKLENLIINMPHPRAKGSTGYPRRHQGDALRAGHLRGRRLPLGHGHRWIRDAAVRVPLPWRCSTTMTNWYVDRAMPLKHMQAISESRSDIGERGKPSYDATYANGPVNYVKLDRLPTVDDMSPIINTMKRGDYFVTSGEVLISELRGRGHRRPSGRSVADVEWTFPLDFVEVVWGDGKKTDRQIIPTTDLPPFGKKRFQIPFDATGKKWVRFAAWDVATNGAFVQPIKLTTATTTTAGK